MKQGWELKKLGEVCNVGYGTRVVNKRDGGSIYPVYGGGGPTFFMDTFNRADCLVVGRFALSEKCTRFVKGQFFLNDSGLTVSPLNKNELFQNFLNLQLLFLNDYIYSLAKGAAQKNLDVSAFKNIEIHYPKSLPEQERIVSILDKAFSAIDQAKQNAKKNLKNAKELFDSYLTGIFANKGEDWEIKKLGEVCQTGAGGTPLKIHKEYYENGNIPWLRSGEVDKKDITNCELFITEQGLNNSSAQLFPVNTVLVAMYGATAGQVGILRFECSTNQAVCGILPNEKFIPEFLYYKFLCCKDELVSQAVGGAQPNISQIKIKNTLVPIPPLPEQEKIVQKLDALSVETKQLEDIYQQKVNELEDLKKSILQKAFNGELI